MQHHSSRLHEIICAAASIALIAPLGLYAKRGYSGPGAEWVHDSLGGVFYVIFWCLLVVLVWPRVTAARIAVAVLIVTCILEFMQLWHSPLLEQARSHFIGRTILGSYFDWSDFPYYFAGNAIAWVWLRAIGRR